MALAAGGRVALRLAGNIFKTVANWGTEADAASNGAQDEEDDLVWLQVRKVVFDNVPANLRTELWLSQLHQGTGLGAAAAAQYPVLRAAQGQLNPEVLAEIDKDTHRTFPGHRRLNTPEAQQAMLDVLAAYALLDPEIGYCQGMNFLAGLLLAYLPREDDAYGALVLLMQQRGLRELYTTDMSLLQVRLWQLGKLLPDRLAAHLEAHAVLPVLYASAWFMTCFASDFPISFAARVLDVVMTDCYASPMMKVAVGILEQCSELLLEMDDMEMILEHIKQDVPKWPKPVLQDLLTQALSKPWTEEQQQTLREMNGAETVVEAVARVNQLSRSRQASDVTAAGVAAAAAAEEGAAAAVEEEGEAAGAQGSEPSMSSASGSADTDGAHSEASRGASSSRTLQAGVTSRSLSQFSSAQFSSAPTLGAVFSYTGGDGSFIALPQFSHRGEGSFLGADWQAKSHEWVQQLQQRAGQDDEQQQQQQQHWGVPALQLSQGDEAPPSAAKLNPLPPPPSARGERVAWDQWQPTVSTVPEEAAPEPQLRMEQLRIEPDIRSTLDDLAPSLTQALSSFRPLDLLSAEPWAPAAAAAAAGAPQPAAPAAAGPVGGGGGGEVMGGVTSPVASLAPPTGAATPLGVSSSGGPLDGAGASVASLGVWGSGLHGSGAYSASLASLPSPFESCHSGHSSGTWGRGASTPSPARESIDSQQLVSAVTSSRPSAALESSSRPSSALEDVGSFGSFQHAAGSGGSTVVKGSEALFGAQPGAGQQPQQQPQPQQQQQPSTGTQPLGEQQWGSKTSLDASGSSSRKSSVKPQGSGSLAEVLDLLTLEKPGGAMGTPGGRHPIAAPSAGLASRPLSGTVAQQQAGTAAAAGPSLGGSSWPGGAAEAAVDLDEYGSWTSADTESPCQLPSPTTSAVQPTQHPPPAQQLARSTSHPAGLRLARPPLGQQPAVGHRVRSYSEQPGGAAAGTGTGTGGGTGDAGALQPSTLVRQLQHKHVESFLQSASPKQAPQVPMKSMRRGSQPGSQP